MTRAMHILAWAALTLGLPIPQIATADPAVGFGLNIIFGGGRMDTGVGIRVFSSDRPNTGAGAIGIDYMLRDQKWRATLGAAYLFDEGYLEVNGGVLLGGARNGFDLGVGAGGTGNIGTNRTSARPVASPLISANQ